MLKGKLKYGVGTLVECKGEKTWWIYGRFRDISELKKGYIFWAEEFEKNNINEKLCMIEFDGRNTKFLENTMREFFEEIKSIKRILRHYNN